MTCILSMNNITWHIFKTGSLYESKFIEGTKGKRDEHYIFVVFKQNKAETTCKIITK